MRGLSPVAASGGHSSSPCAGLSLSWPPLLRSTDSRCAGSVVVAHGPSCSAACGILPDQGPNPCPPHRQADSQPLHHQGSPAALLTMSPSNQMNHAGEGSGQLRFRMQELLQILWSARHQVIKERPAPSTSLTHLPLSRKE